MAHQMACQLDSGESWANLHGKWLQKDDHEHQAGGELPSLFQGVYLFKLY